MGRCFKIGKLKEKGYRSITVSAKTMDELKRIKEENGLMTIPETIRMIVRKYEN